MGAAQIVLIAWLTGIVAVSAAKHGEPLPTATHHVGWTLFRTAIFVALLVWGGFWP